MVERKIRTIAVLEILTGAGLLLFWIGFFTIGLAPENPPECYFAYEHSFPLPDTIMSLFFLAGGAMLLKGRPMGRVLSIACAGALVFLGVLDFSFNIQNGVYTISTLDLVLNSFINTWSVAFGAAVIIVLRK